MQIIKLNAIDSTNRYLADLVSEISLEDFAAVMAIEQTNGQGQRGSKWQSEKGKNLIISIIIGFSLFISNFISSTIIIISYWWIKWRKRNYSSDRWVKLWSFSEKITGSNA